MKITRVYTKTGDKGTTSLVGGVRIKKSDIRLEAYGTVDELSAHLGLLAAMMTGDDNRQTIIRIQNNLFNVCTHLATDQSQTPLYPSAHLAEGETAFLEQEVDRLMALLPERQGFILPGGTQAAERRIAALAEVATVGEEIQQYVNRLSDYLFVLAKIINFNSGQDEIIWQNACK